MKNVVIVLNYNDYETTRLFIDNHYGNSYIDKIIIVDNYSTDGSYDVLRKIENEKCEVIKTDRNGGYAYGNNFGANYAITKYDPDIITIANPDIFISEDAFYKVLDIYNQRTDAAICSCIMSSAANYHTLSAWKQPKYFDCCIACINGVKNLFRWHLEYKDKYLAAVKVTIKEVDVIAGSFFCISKDAFIRANGFDERTFLYYEEAILSCRVKKQGYKNYLAVDVSYLHEHAVSINKNIKSISRRLDILQESRLVYCRNYLAIGFIKEKILQLMYQIGKKIYLQYLKLR